MRTSQDPSFPRRRESRALTQSATSLWLLLFSVAACNAPANVANNPPASLEGRFILKELAQPTSTKPESFNPDDWAKGLILPQQPSAIVLSKGAISSEGVLALSGTITGQIRGDSIQFSIAEEGGGTRLELQFNGTYDASSNQIQGQLVQQWGLTDEEDSGGVTLSGKALFIRQ
jgi:hypothetical protein